LTIIDLGQSAGENAAVAQVRTTAAYATTAQSLPIEAELKNFGHLPRNGQPVELLVDGRRADEETVDLAAGASAPVAFSCRFDTPGDHAVEVRMKPDGLEVDDSRWMTVAVKQCLRVLCVDGRPSSDRLAGAAGYLELALAPREAGEGRALVRPEVVPEGAWLERDLAGYDCVFLCEVAQWTSNEASALRSYVDNGGRVVFFLGQGVVAEAYKEQLGGEASGGLRLLPARLGPIVETPPDPSARLDPQGYRHPIVSAFRGRESAGLLSTPIHKYFRLQSIPDSAAKVALYTAAGDPLIVEEPIGQGRVVLVATSAADLDWTAMPFWHSYPALIQELLAFAVEGQMRQRNLIVGQPLGEPIWAPAGDVPLSLQLPDGRREEIRVRPRGDYAAWSYPNTTLSGIYTADYGPPLDRSDRFAVNVDTVESDLTKLTADQVREEVWPGVAFEVQTSWQSTEDQPLAPINRRSLLSGELLAAALALLLAELFLGFRFGYHGT
jgi:hypothetical protein